MTTNPLEQLQDQAINSTNYYAMHLAEVDKKTAVISTEDIINTENIPLVKKGTRITSEIAKRIIKHKLHKPIEQQVDIEQSVKKNTLFKEFELVLEKYPDLKQIHEHSGLQKSFKILVNTYIVSPLITQKLTVFSKQLPTEFEKTLFCTLLAMNIAYAAKLTKDEIITTFLTGLTHDLGLLHISPDSFSDQEKLSVQQWRDIQTHVVTGYLFVASLGIEYKHVAKAILEHHERCDGTGYPVAKTAAQLGTVGQIIAMADSLQAIRVNQFEEVGRNLRSALPFLKMNEKTHSELVYRATVSIINTVSEENTSVTSFVNQKEHIEYLISRGNKLGNASAIVELITHLSNELTLLEDGQTMLRVIIPFNHMIRQSGIIEEHIVKWLEHVDGTESYNPDQELCELELMQNELYWQLKKVSSTYINFLEKEPDAGSEELMLYLLKVSAEIDSFL